MKTTKILFLLFTLMLTLCSTQTFAEETPNLDSFLKLTKMGKHGMAIDEFKKFTTIEHLKLKNILLENEPLVPPLYFILLADYVYKTDKDTALFLYVEGFNRARQDVYSCKDKTARNQIRFYAEFAYNTSGYAGDKIKDRKYRRELNKKVLEWDRKHPERISPIWACYHGIKSFEGKPQLHSERKIKRIRKMHSKL